MYNELDVLSQSTQKEKIMSRIESFKRALAEKRAVKINAGIDYFDVKRIKKVVNIVILTGFCVRKNYKKRQCNIFGN